MSEAPLLNSLDTWTGPALCAVASGCKWTAVYADGARLSQEQMVTSSFQGRLQLSSGLFVVPHNPLRGPDPSSHVLHGT